MTKMTEINIGVEICAIKDKLADCLAFECKASMADDSCPMNALSGMDCPFNTPDIDIEICNFITKDMWLKALTEES